MESYTCAKKKVDTVRNEYKLPDGRTVISTTSTHTQICVQDKGTKK